VVGPNKLASGDVLFKLKTRWAGGGCLKGDTSFINLKTIRAEKSPLTHSPRELHRTVHEPKETLSGGDETDQL